MKREKVIIMSGIDRGVIPMNVLPEDLSGRMGSFYDRIFHGTKEGYGKKEVASAREWFAWLVVFLLMTLFISGLVEPSFIYRWRLWNVLRYQGWCGCLIDQGWWDVLIP